MVTAWQIDVFQINAFQIDVPSARLTPKDYLRRFGKRPFVLPDRSFRAFKRSR